MNIYKGRNSCYYRREGILVTHDWEIPDLVMRDLRRGCTYDHESDFLPALEGRGFPSKGFIVPTIGSGLHPSFGGQSSGSENHSHLKIASGVWGYPPQVGLSSLSSSPLNEGIDVTRCSSHSPIKPSIELRRSVISVTKRHLEKEIFKVFYKGAIHPRWRGFPPP